MKLQIHYNAKKQIPLNDVRPTQIVFRGSRNSARAALSAISEAVVTLSKGDGATFQETANLASGACAEVFARRANERRDVVG